ncbi:hypothetical protein [Acidomonas methanolica]|uniref:hypothetical protein n=1 Tax=Acidomonas methanolica TaxID=437 RepID=UPI00211A48C6|nr:hypothetical protein [Acidomonas methanolica]
MMIAEQAHDDEVCGDVDRRGGLEPVPAINVGEGGHIPELYFTDLASLQEAVVAGEDADLRTAAIAAVRRSGLRSGLSDGIPFILGDDAA